MRERQSGTTDFELCPEGLDMIAGPLDLEVSWEIRPGRAETRLAPAEDAEIDITEARIAASGAVPSDAIHAALIEDDAAMARLRETILDDLRARHEMALDDGYHSALDP